MPLTHTVYVRCYGNLKDFLPIQKRSRQFSCLIKGCPSVKDTLEAVGIPHTDIDAIRINGQNGDFNSQLKEGSRIEVFSPRHAYKKSVRHLTPKPYALHFVVDSHLGKLARSLRLLGFDTLYQNIFPDQLIISLAARQKRLVLTRDKGLLKQKKVKWGYWVRHIRAQKQIREVVHRYELGPHIKAFTRCLECNGLIKRVIKKDILGLLPPKVKKYYRYFYRCRSCRHVYWKGSHYKKLSQVIRRLKDRCLS